MACRSRHKKAETYSEPAKLLEFLVEVGKFRHDGNPVLAWMASNTVVERRVNGSILPKKQHRDLSKKIDAIVALILAMSCAAMRSDAKSIYDRPELWSEPPKAVVSDAPAFESSRERFNVFAMADDDD